MTNQEITMNAIFNGVDASKALNASLLAFANLYENAVIASEMLGDGLISADAHAKLAANLPNEYALKAAFAALLDLSCAVDVGMSVVSEELENKTLIYNELNFE